MHLQAGFFDAHLKRRIGLGGGGSKNVAGVAVGGELGVRLLGLLGRRLLPAYSCCTIIYDLCSTLKAAASAAGTQPLESRKRAEVAFPESIHKRVYPPQKIIHSFSPLVSRKNIGLEGRRSCRSSPCALLS